MALNRVKRKDIKRTDKVTVVHKKTEIQFFFEPNSEMKSRMIKRSNSKKFNIKDE